MALHPQVWIVVLHFLGADKTRECLKSLAGLRFPGARLLLVSNGSPDSSGDPVAAEFPGCDYLRLPENLGFAGGSNAGVRYCIERGAQWIWLLNNDTQVHPEALSRLMEVATSESDAGLLGAAVFTPSPGGPVRSGSGTIDFLRAKTFEKGAFADDAASVRCQWLSGCNLLIRADAFVQTGGFDERFFLYFEDVDLCLRFKNKGWQCLLVPSARIDHIGCAATGDNLATWRSYYYTRNRLLFFLRYRQGWSAIPIALAVGAHFIRHAIVLPFRGTKGRRQLRAEFLGLRDFFLNRLGKAECLDF